jgi:hypothetical protein
LFNLKKHLKKPTQKEMTRGGILSLALILALMPFLTTREVASFGLALTIGVLTAIVIPKVTTRISVLVIAFVLITAGTYLVGYLIPV